MDLLHGAVGAMATRTDKRRKPGQDADKFKTDEDTGRMIIDEDDADSDDPTTATTGDAIAGGAYHETLTSADGFTRGANGRIKFNKDTKKRRRDNADVEDVEMGSAATATQGPSPGKKAKSRQEPRFGSEFKAKVSSASRTMTYCC
jgi:ribosomal RNA-processing protein 12